ncbi:response regulator [Effusibacillus pohliae]|uniref:response regulator n=1 Tax=Effusibacillus pohliae TaxID=232270 RepID=UPI0003749771|nr:response regulator [Effusibacillus pohliae]
MAKILIVDDAAFMRMMLKNILAQHGHEVIGEAVTGKEAVEKYQLLRPDLVTMDITMPDMDGIEAVEKIRQLDPDAKIIMCSAVGQEVLVRKAISLGAKDFVVKPFEADRVVSAINQLFE